MLRPARRGRNWSGWDELDCSERSRALPYGWVAAAVVFLILLVAAGTRATPSVLMVPLGNEFGWGRATVSLAISINIALYGLTGPFAAAAMQRFGLRPTILTALVVMGTGVALSSMMTATWQMVLMVGSATGVAALTLSATFVNRWFVARRELVMACWPRSRSITAGGRWCWRSWCRW